MLTVTEGIILKNKSLSLFHVIQYFMLLLMAAGFLAIPTLANAANEKEIQKDVIARVNGVPIKDERIAATVANRMSYYRKMGSQLPEEQLKRQIQLKELDALIGQELLTQAAITVDPKMVEERLAKRLASHAPAPDPGTGSEDKDKLRKEIQHQILLEQKGLNDLKVNEQEIRSFYQNNLKSFSEPRSMKVQHILVRVPGNATKEQLQAARLKTDGILSDLKQDKDFAELARTVSDCSSKESGGDLGLIKEGYMPPEFDAVAFKLKPGQISEIVKTRYGFHIIRVTEQFPARQQRFEEVQEYIAKYLKLEMQRKKMNEFVQELKNSAKIEILI